jgi:hypothetical protein
MPVQTATTAPTKKQTPGSAAMDRIMGRTPQPTTPAPQKQLSAALASAPPRQQQQAAPAAPQSDIQRWQASAARQRSATPAPQRATPSVDYQRGPAPSGRTDTAMGDEDRAAALQGARRQMEMGSRGVPTRDSEYASALAAQGNRLGADVTRRPPPVGSQDWERGNAIQAQQPVAPAVPPPQAQPAAPATFPGQQPPPTVGQPQNWLNQSRSEYFNDDLPFFLR